MKVITPVAVTSDKLVSSSIPETDYPAWSASTTYAKGARVVRATTHRIYESLSDGNLNYVPEANTNWLDIGPTNRWAMFDQVVGTASSAIGSIDIKASPGAVSAVALLDTNAQGARVIVRVGGSTLYDVTKNTAGGSGVITDWYAYFMADLGRTMTLIFESLPLYGNAQIEVQIAGADPGAPVSVGTLIFGNALSLGATEASPTIGLTDFSRKETDDFGVTTIVERPWSKRMQLRTMMDTAAVDLVYFKLATLRARPALWIGEDGYDALAIYGFFKDFSIDLALPNISYCSFTLEGLI